MKSIMANLRNLVLPSGATSGQRVIIDGDHGKIEVYDANNHLIVAIGTEVIGTTTFVGLISLDPVTGVVTQLDQGLAFDNTTGSALTFTNQPEVFLTPSTDVNTPNTLTSTSGAIDPAAHGAQLDLVSNTPAGAATPAGPYAYVHGNGTNPPAVPLVVTGPVKAAHAGGPGPETWQPLTFANGWSSDANGIGADFMVDDRQWVVLKGIVKGGTLADGTTLATLPAGYRPNWPGSGGVLLPVALNGSNAGGRINILATGEIKCYGAGAAGSIGLDLTDCAFPLSTS